MGHIIQKSVQDNIRSFIKYENTAKADQIREVQRHVQGINLAADHGYAGQAGAA